MTPLHTKEEEILIELWRGFANGVGQGGFVLGSLKDGESAEVDFCRLDKFIRRALAQYREALVQEVEKMKKSDGCEYCEDHFHDEALEKVITILQEKGKKECCENCWVTQLSSGNHDGTEYAPVSEPFCSNDTCPCHLAP